MKIAKALTIGLAVTAGWLAGIATISWTKAASPRLSHLTPAQLDDQQRPIAMQHGRALLCVQRRMRGRRRRRPGIRAHSFDLLRKALIIHCDTLKLLCRCSFHGSPYM
jgi:hypothetical protein